MISLNVRESIFLQKILSYIYLDDNLRAAIYSISFDFTNTQTFRIGCHLINELISTVKLTFPIAILLQF